MQVVVAQPLENASKPGKREPMCFQKALLRRMQIRAMEDEAYANFAGDDQFRSRKRLAPDGLQNLRLVALRQPHDLARRRGRQETHTQFIFRFGTQTLDQRQPPAHPTLVAPKQLGHFYLANPVFSYQSLDNPCFFELTGAATGAVQPTDGGLGGTLVSLQQPSR